jgi:malate dehydrogenase (quinone)
MSFVWGRENVDFLKTRHATMIRYAIFQDMLYTEETAQMAEWMPIMMEGREINEPIAATRMAIGTDVNFGSLTREMIAYLQQSEAVEVCLGQEVEDITRLKDGRW